MEQPSMHILSNTSTIFFTKCPPAAQNNINDWKKYINQHFTDNCLTINALINRKYQKSIALPKGTLLDLNYKKIELLYKIKQYDYCSNSLFSKKNLALLHDLPESILESLKDYFHLGTCDGYHPPTFDYRIQFNYQRTFNSKKIQQTILENDIKVSLLVIPALVYNHFFVGPIANKWESISWTLSMVIPSG